MSENKEDRELPTAARRKEGHTPDSIRNQLTVTEYGVEKIAVGDELVRRADANDYYIGKIEDRIEEVEEKLEEESGFDRLNRNDLKARKEELQNLKEVFSDV